MEPGKTCQVGRPPSNRQSNAHDLYLVGNNVEFHHNLIRNLHDDALFLDPETIANGVVHHNVIEQVLTGFSSASANIVASP